MKNPSWTWKPIGELFDIGSGKTMSAAARAGIQKVPFLRTSNVLWDEIDLCTLDEMVISEKELAEKSLRSGDLLVCEGGEIGRAAVWEESISRISFQNHLHRLRPVSRDIDAHFYVYFLQSAFTQLGLFEGAGNKTTIPNLSRNRLAALEVPRPPYEEQKAIAGTLAAVREAIKVHDKANRATQELKSCVMQQVFTHGLRGEPQQETEIGLLPKSWEVSPIKSLCDILSGGTPRKSVAKYWEGSIPWISGKDLKFPSLNDAIDHISEEGVDNGSRIVPEGTVLLLVRGMGLAKDLPVAVITRPMAFNQDIKALVSRGRFSGDFLRSAIYSGKERLLSRIVASAHGTMTLNLNDVESYKIACPADADEADEIVSILKAIDGKIDLHRKKRAVLDELFKSLLQKLMTGDVSVEDLDLSTLSDVTSAHEEALS